MFKTSVTESDNKITVDIVGLQNMLSVGKGTADKIGQDAGAIIRMGRRKLYNVSKVQAYLDNCAKGV